MFKKEQKSSFFLSLLFPLTYLISGVVALPFSAFSSDGFSPEFRIRILHKGNIKHVSFEEYISGVLEGEIPMSWPIEVLKAQAVVSRSYAIYLMKKEGKKVLGTDVMNQVWREPKNSRSRLAVRETRGWVLVFPTGDIAPGFFHSTCGGYTENAWEVWSGDPNLRYIKGVKCGKCYDSPHFFWRRKMKFRKFMDILKHLRDPISYTIKKSDFVERISVERTTSGRVSAVIFNEGAQNLLYISGEEMRKTIGLPSTFFTFEIVERENAGNKTIYFYGRGFGHGVGLCQWGAKKLAEEGKNWREILKFYFPLLGLKKIY